MHFIMVGRHCGVTGCNNNSMKCPGLAFFCFPTDKDRCKAWIEVTQRLDIIGKEAYVTKGNIRICASHFEPWCFMNQERKKLVWNAVPTLSHGSQPHTASQLSSAAGAPLEQPLPQHLPDVTPSTSANFRKVLKTLTYIEEEQGKIRAARASREETKKKVRSLIYTSASVSATSVYALCST